jgi:hypothetical protein
VSLPHTLEPGQLILHRQFARDRLVCVRTARVVGHDERGLRLWIANGNPVLGWETVDGRGIRDVSFAEWAASEYRLAPQSWRGPDILMFMPTGQNHSVWWFWDEEGDFACWYINLEETGVMWRADGLVGVDTVDQDLDLVVSPDRGWKWKDEDEFAERLGFPDHYWVLDEAAVWAEGRRVVELVEAGVFPFDGTWCSWRPDPAWARPAAMPDGFDRPRAY